MSQRDPEDLAFLSLAALTAGYGAGNFSPVEVVEAAIARAGALEHRLNAFAWLDRDGAGAAAAASEARWQAGNALGPLDGVPLTVKDLTAVRGMPLRQIQDALLTAGIPARLELGRPFAQRRRLARRPSSNLRR